MRSGPDGIVLEAPLTPSSSRSKRQKPAGGAFYPPPPLPAPPRSPLPVEKTLENIVFRVYASIRARRLEGGGRGGIERGLNSGKVGRISRSRGAIFYWHSTGRLKRAREFPLGPLDSRQIRPAGILSFSLSLSLSSGASLSRHSQADS